jgi:Ca2+-dependent lipid-binding protein
MAPTAIPTSKVGGNNKMGIGKVLKSVGKLPRGLKVGRGPVAKVAQIENELPAVLLKIQIVGCKDLRAADSNGKSDPSVLIAIMVCFGC